MPRPRTPSLSPRWATTGVFFVNGAAIGTWVAQIPWIQQRFDLSETAIGLVIAGMALAVVIAFPIAGQAVVKHGSERMVWIGGIATALAVSLPVLAPEPVLVAGGLFVLGGSSATMDVSMNSHGVGVERCLERPIMSSLHAGWAFGGMAGASFAALLSALGADPRVTVALASGLMLVALVASARRIGPGSEAEGEQAPRITLASMLLIAHPAAALLGLFAIGLGVSNGVPLMFSAAGRQPNTLPGPAIAAVSSMGSLGFLAGPPLIGFLAGATSLPWALATLILGAAAVFALARRATGERQPAAV